MSLYYFTYLLTSLIIFYLWTFKISILKSLLFVPYLTYVMFYMPVLVFKPPK